MDNCKISVGVWSYGSCSDRYVGKGYKPYISFIDRVNEISKLEDVQGIEVTFPGDVNKDNIEIVKALLKEKNLSIPSMGVELVCDGEWKTGSFTSPDIARRQKSIQLTKDAMDVASELNISVVSLWLGQDGFDYVFQNDYKAAWNNLIEGLRECADYNPKIKLGLEYKNSEPKMSCMVNSGGKALALSQAVGRKNVGITLDVGHAFNAGENPAEIASILISEERLFHLHLNDNYRIADDDMPVGSVHWPQYLELFYWLKKLKYEGWYSLDLYPYRDNPTAACRASITFIKGAVKFINEKLGENDFGSNFKGDPGDILNSLYKKMFGL